MGISTTAKGPPKWQEIPYDTLSKKSLAAGQLRSRVASKKTHKRLKEEFGKAMEKIAGCGIFVKKKREYGIRTPFSVLEPAILIPAAKKTSADAIVTGLLSYDDIFLIEGRQENISCRS